MKKISMLSILMLAVCLTACGASDAKKQTKEDPKEAVSQETEAVEAEELDENLVKISLSNDKIFVNEEEISKDSEADVYIANDIIFYLEDQGIEYGDGTETDSHSQIEGDAHRVVHITKPGTYEISGTMDAGQIFVDLGDGTKNDEEAVATIILNNADITCTVAPAILFYRTYECAGDVEKEDAAMEVDTTTAGANLVLAEGSDNKIYGAYVAEIYEECELNEDGTEVIDSKKLHKFDGAVYSRRSMNVSGNGALDIIAENEGLCSEMHLTINGGEINIRSGNDGVNTSEDHISVFTMNDGSLKVQVTGETGEGDGIDSNGWLVINGGFVESFACATSMDAGLDADQGVYINGGIVVASGNMNAEIAEGKQQTVSFLGRAGWETGKKYEIKDAEETVLMEVSPKNTFSVLTVSMESMNAEESYSLWLGDEKIAEGMSGAAAFAPGMGGERPPIPNGEFPEGMMPPEGMAPSEKPKKM